MTMPLKTHWFHILSALANEDLHGLGIVRNVLDQTDGALRLWPVTLYGALENMADEGLIRELIDGELPEGVSARRRYYRITQKGRETLRMEAHRLASMASAALERLERA